MLKLTTLTLTLLLSAATHAGTADVLKADLARINPNPVQAAAPAPQAALDAALVGTWVASNAVAGALEGSIVLNKDRTMVLRPQGKPDFPGTWAVPRAGTLFFDIPEAGGAEMAYSLKKTRLTLTYENGNVQAFVRQASVKKVAKK